MKGLLTRALARLAVSPKIREMEEAMAAEYRVSAKEWRAREKVEDLQREFQRKKAEKEYEDWKISRPEPPPTIQKISSPVTDLSYSSNETSNRVMDEINQLHAQLLRTGAGSDIGGTWRISCPEISGWHGDSMSRNTDVTWIIHPAEFRIVSMGPNRSSHRRRDRTNRMAGSGQLEGCFRSFRMERQRRGHGGDTVSG